MNAKDGGALRSLRAVCPLRQRGESGEKLERVAKGDAQCRLRRRTRGAFHSVEGSASSQGLASASVGINYLPVNIAPVVDEIAVEPGARVNEPAQQTGQPQPVNINLPSAQTGLSYVQDPATAPLPRFKDRTAVTVRWAAHDDNGDDLLFDVYIRGDGEKNWRLLRARVTERYYSFDSIRLPDGGYRLKVVASDAPSHPLGDALTGERESDHFVIDTTPPVLLSLQGDARRRKDSCQLSRRRMPPRPLAHAEYSLDAGPWQYLEPVGKLSDSLTEHYDFTIPLAAACLAREDRRARLPVTDPAEHVLTVRVYDRYDNVGAAKTVVH